MPKASSIVYRFRWMYESTGRRAHIVPEDENTGYHGAICGKQGRWEFSAGRVTAQCPRCARSLTDRCTITGERPTRLS